MKKIIIPALAALGLSAGAVQAASFTVDYQNAKDPFGKDGQYSWVTIDSEVYDGTFRAGGFNMTSSEMGDFVAFCVEVTQGLRNGHAYDNVVNPFGDAVTANVQSLFNSAYTRVIDNKTAAAFQVALWEIVEDTAIGFDLASGSFSAKDANTTGVVATAKEFLKGLADAPKGLFEIDFLLSPTSQDLVTARRAEPSPVPLPASGLMLLSAGAFFVARRKKS